ncbi:FAD-binding protein [candidate division KSB1 bacterium]|nr:FAD-binding protein [candidate division KSB1 bacterium]
MIKHKNSLHNEFSSLIERKNTHRFHHQQRARELLFDQSKSELDDYPRGIVALTERLSDGSDVFQANPVQQIIYEADTGTHIIPPLFKLLLTSFEASAIIRPGSIHDLCTVIEWANRLCISYTIRGAGTWPFGGAVPSRPDVVIDTSALDFMEINQDASTLILGAGALFPDVREHLRRNGFRLRQEITNTASGTVCGWIATGGLGLGTYKYGHVKNAVKSLLVVTPSGKLNKISADDAEYDYYFGSEGHFGIIAGVEIHVNQESHVSKVYAFSFESTEDAHQFMTFIKTAELSPTSLIYFNENYIRETYRIENSHAETRSAEALRYNDQIRLAESRQDYELIQQLKQVQHLIVMEFDDKTDYEKALKSRLFGASGEQKRIQHIQYTQLPTALAHIMWNHRYLPVQMKQNGPSLLVSETVLPFEAFPEHQFVLQKFLKRLASIELKSEAHLLPDGDILVQSILQADTRTLRHKLYFALVPLMASVAYHFRAKPYGIGLWNYPFMGNYREIRKDRFYDLQRFKKQTDPKSLINRAKFLNPCGQTIAFKIFRILSPIFCRQLVSIYHRRLNGKFFWLSYPFEKLMWRINELIFPHVIPPALKAAENDSILSLTAVCAECDSCERVCPTSDVFGNYGPATPITRRHTANRIAYGEQISQREAIGFLACTRCDNCTRICPTSIPLTELFDRVEQHPRFINALGLDGNEKEQLVQRFWHIMKESPLYSPHTLSDLRNEKSHLEHGLAIHYNKGFAYSHLYIDPFTCIHCGMCADENACIYGARSGHARHIPELLDINCALCNACINYCPQNKRAQEERQFLDQMIFHAPDLDEKKYWRDQQNRIHDTTKVIRSVEITEVADRYVTEEVIMEIDKEASTGQIPVSGSGQGDRHMGIGFDAERFAHFHIVGPAQNRLHEGDPEEELTVILGKREDFCKFDRNGKLVNPKHATVKLMTPILYNAIELESNGNIELVFTKVAESQGSLVVIPLENLLEHYTYILQHGNYDHLPPVVIPRVDHELIHRIIVNPHTNREFLNDLWRMPVFEVEYHVRIDRTLRYIRDSVRALNHQPPLICGFIEISEYDLVGSLTLNADIKEKINHFLDLGVDIIHVHGMRNKDQYYVTSQAVRALHHYLMRIGRRHEVSIIASGGIRLASDTQKTIQRGAEATLIDFAALLALDPSSYQAMIENKSTTEKLISLDIEWALKRLNNQADSRKVQILEVLGASGFKDIKKTVGEEGRLIDFHKLENRIQRTIFENTELIKTYTNLNNELIENEPIPKTTIRTYSQLKKLIQPCKAPHDFYRLGDSNQHLYKRDYVWPGPVIESMGRMASGDFNMLDFSNVKGTGLLGDGFDVMQILYNKTPMDIPEHELDQVSTVILLDKNLLLEAPWMFGGKSVGSIGLDTWRAHVVASRELGIQFDTGEGGYPTCFFLNSKGEPIFFTESEIQQIKPYFQSGRSYTIEEMSAILSKHGITRKNSPDIYQKIDLYPSLKPFHFKVVVDDSDEPYISTELKTGLFGVTKDTIKKARRVVIAYSQGAKMGIGGHILSQKVNKLVSYMRGVDGLESVNISKVESLYNQLKQIAENPAHQLKDAATAGIPILDETEHSQQVTNELKTTLRTIQDQAYQLHAHNAIDPIQFERIIRDCEELITHSYSSIISPFPFHNCYSIEDVKAFIDVVRMINPQAAIAIKVSPSIDIQFIATGLARIARDNTAEMMRAKFGNAFTCDSVLTQEMAEYARKFGMCIEIWLDGPRGGTGASPNIIKGQMGMHIEYAIPLIHHSLVQDGLRNHVKFMVSGGIRTYEDVIKAVALGADGVIWGTAPLVAIGCDRNRNCHDGCSRGIATSNLVLQQLRDVELNTQQIINAFTIMQMQVIRALAALGCRDIRELRGRYDKIHWLGLKERVDHRYRIHAEVIKEIEKDEQLFLERMKIHATAQTNCGVAAINGTVPIPAHILDRTLHSMRNRGMDGVGVAKTMCFPDHPDDFAFRVLVKGILQIEMEDIIRRQWIQRDEKFTTDQLRGASRQQTIELRTAIMQQIKSVFLDPYFDYTVDPTLSEVRELYKSDNNGDERDFRDFGNEHTDPGDIFCFFLWVKPHVLELYIESELLNYRWSRFLRQLFPNITRRNYKFNTTFMQKAEDMFVFNHATKLSRILYTSTVLDHEFQAFSEQPIAASIDASFFINRPIAVQHHYLKTLHDFVNAHPYEQHRHRYVDRSYKIAAVMSCGKNFGLWKTAGREIPWQTPDALNNIIHVRLATGSVVEQMNSHPFGKLHTALTHNGETTNYEALKQRVEQFDLSPLAGTDTEVAALKFHLTADEWEYPDWALFESFSPTTGDDLKLIDPAIQPQLEAVQHVEFTSSPDGPYQYLCLRHNPYKRTTERVDLKDPADLRPNISAFWYDMNAKTPKAFSIIASEEQAVAEMLRQLDTSGIIDGAEADTSFTSSGMISRYHFDNRQRIKKWEFIDRYGSPISLEPSGNHFSVRRAQLISMENLMQFSGWTDDYQSFIRDHLASLSFDEYNGLLNECVQNSNSDDLFAQHLAIFTFLNDYIRTFNPGPKAMSSLLDITRYHVSNLLSLAASNDIPNYQWVDQQRAGEFHLHPRNGQSLIINAEYFLAEGTDPAFSLSAFLSHSHNLGWRKFIIYNARGQRLISPAVMGTSDTDDVIMDVYGSVGEYFAAFMKGGTVRLHGNAQNFAAMCMHHGNLSIFGNAGKVCGYASKGGHVFIMGNVVDRIWTNSVNDSRCQDLEVTILGSATKYAGESLMGGQFLFAGLHFNQHGELCFNARPYLGTKMFGGASRGQFVFFDPEDRLVAAQYVHGHVSSFTDAEWAKYEQKFKALLLQSNIQTIINENGQESIWVDGKQVSIGKAQFKLIIPKGGLKGYESH